MYPHYNIFTVPPFPQTTLPLTHRLFSLASHPTISALSSISPTRLATEHACFLAATRIEIGFINRFRLKNTFQLHQSSRCWSTIPMQAMLGDPKISLRTAGILEGPLFSCDSSFDTHNFKRVIQRLRRSCYQERKPMSPCDLFLGSKHSS